MSDDENSKWADYTNEQLESKLESMRAELECTHDVYNFDAARSERQQQMIKLLHDYNEIKDATQTVLGALASMQGVTIKEMHLKYELPLEDA